ncbi:flagellar type III secretion system pore protein FliP [Clostridium intestinale]|uniref:Flagellar biosynthetic protein FliP n=1 Tax=Clostridium intestinale URNW TaxID=1294142 RepID=U2N852_9CLOT|nr:flagellar type III secretion system pore protein FliP [Clostridium intestinale]ERK31697.1 flagellar biosynthesis protein FliP [Clostridium intestinale URNW]
MKKKRVIIYTIMFLAIFFTISHKAFAAPNLSVSLDGGDTPTDYVTNIKLLIFLTILTLLPSFIVMVTSFTRIAVVLSFLKNAIGAQQAIPSQVMVGLSLFLTLFIMQPVYNEINTNALQPYMENKITQEQAIEAGSKPLREFMIKQTRPKDLELFVETSKIDTSNLTKDNVPLYVVIPAFVISELKTAFTIGFLIFLPFLIIDMVVASVLMSMGMFMLPPVMVSLPFKLLLFAMVDGWYLIVKSLIMSFA